MLTEDFGIPVFTTWLEISPELTGKELSSSAVDVDSRIGPDECKVSIVWSDLVSMCVDTNDENLPVWVAVLCVVAPNEGEGDGDDDDCGIGDNDDDCGIGDNEDVCVDCGSWRDGEDKYDDHGVWELEAVGTVCTELVFDGA